MGPPSVGFPLLLLLLYFASLFSPGISQITDPNITTNCTITPITPSTLDTQVTVYENISYYSITMPQTAAGFRLKIGIRGFDSRTCSFEAFMGDDSNVCPGPKNSLRSIHGPHGEFFATSPKTHYFALHSINCTSIQVTFQIFATCPSFCTGPGAQCSTTTGCFCGNNFYNPLEGCFITGPCDPTSNFEYTCAVANGYGNQTCNIDRRTNTTFLGFCTVTECQPGFIIDYRSNSCRRRPAPPPPPGNIPASVETKAWWRVGSLGTAASVLIWCAEGLAVIVVLGVAVFFVLRRRHNHQYAKYNSESSDSDEQL